MTESTTVIVQCNGCDAQLNYPHELPRGHRERRERWASMLIHGLTYDFCEECWSKMLDAVDFIDPYQPKMKKR